VAVRLPNSILQGMRPVLVGWLLIGLVMAAGSATGTLLGPATFALINLTLVVGLYLFVGNSGVLSFGHFAFALIGAYVTAVLTVPTMTKSLLIPEMPDSLVKMQASGLVAIILAGLVAGTVALILGWPLMRLNGLGAGIATLALLAIAKTMFGNYPGTGGNRAFGAVPLNTTLVTAAVWAGLFVLLIGLADRTRTMLRLRASRDEEIAARSVGIGVTTERWLAFVGSAVIFGVGGGLYVGYVGTLQANQLYFDYTFLIIAMLVIGGTSDLAGVLIGTVLVSSVSEVVLRMENGQSVGPWTLHAPQGSREIVIALVTLAALIVRHQGIRISRIVRWKRELDSAG
jgi:branched-chain amino acid transport system permease protein